MADPVKLYHSAVSHYCEKARAVLALKGIPFEIVPVHYQDHTPVLEASGQDYVPYLEVPGEAGVLWPDVADWAEARVPEPSLYPGGGETRARSRLVESWAHGVVEPATWLLAVPRVPERLSDPVERWAFVELQEARRGRLEDLDARRDALRLRVVDVLALAGDLLGGKPFLLGSEPSLADLALFGAVHPLVLVGEPVPAEVPGLAAWHERVTELVGSHPPA